jgi:hypothetical protein
MSASGMMCASFSHLSSSESISIYISASIHMCCSGLACNIIKLKRKLSLQLPAAAGFQCGRHTKSSTDTLAPCREGECLSNGHLWDVKVMLADVRRRPLWHKLLHPMTIVGNSSWSLQCVYIIITPYGKTFIYNYCMCTDYEVLACSWKTKTCIPGTHICRLQ